MTVPHARHDTLTGMKPQAQGAATAAKAGSAEAPSTKAGPAKCLRGWGVLLTLTAVSSTLLVGAQAVASNRPEGASPTVVHPVKVLTIMEENHSFAQMVAGMPYLWSLGRKYGYATKWTSISHPSLPNYLAIVAGSTFGITDDRNPAAHQIKANTVFGQALNAGLTAKTYNESMPANCYLTNSNSYAVRHNPWTYFTPSRTRCQNRDTPSSSLLTDAANNGLPAAGMVTPNLYHDAHNGSLAAADGWLLARLPTILASTDFTSGRLAVVITTDESSARSSVLTVVLDANLAGKVVTTPLNHYSLTRFYAQAVGVTPLRKGKSAPNMRAAFGL